MSQSIDFNNELKGIYTDLSHLQGVQVNALTKQQGIKKMIDNENDRLSEKKNTIDQAIQNQKRIIYFNDNNRKISSAYLMIIISVAITLGMVFVVRVIFHHLTILPDMLFNILIVSIVSIGLIIAYNYYLTIIYRDPYNFDELKLTAPSINHIKEDSSSNDLIVPQDSPNGCIGSDCCTPSTNSEPGTEWSKNEGRCIFSPAGSNISTIVVPNTPEPSYSQIN
jgi:hypothetical protein